jgi:hypothetical protein
MTSDDITLMQFKLRRLGYSCYVTGVHDQRSISSLKAFQRDLKLPCTGVFSEEDLQKLNRCLGISPEVSTF